MKMKPVGNWLLLGTLCLLGVSCRSGDTSDEGSVTDATGLGTPGSQPTLLGPGTISTHLNELNATFSPDGNMFLYTVANNSCAHTFYTIFMVEHKQRRWSTPRIVPFSGQYSDADPFFAPDGKRVYFVSCRPVSSQGEPNDNFDIWYVNYVDGRWSMPERLSESINSKRDELYPCLTATGNLYFSTENGATGYDIMRAENQHGQLGAPRPVSDSINTKGIEFDAFVTADERTMVFTAMGRPDGMGSGDLYVSHNKKGSWTKGQNIGSPINSIFMDQCPSISTDGQKFYFTSFRDNGAYRLRKRLSTKEYINLVQSPYNGMGNIFWLTLTGKKHSMIPGRG